MSIDLVKKLLGFTALLRKLGLRVGTSEAVDALLAVTMVDLLDKNQVKMALAAALVKDRLHGPVFSAAFDEYFACHDQCRKADERIADEEGEQLSVQGRPLDLAPELERVYRSLARDERSKLQDFLDRTSRGKKVGPQHDLLIVQLVSGHLRRIQDVMGRDAAPQSVTETGDPVVDQMLSNIAERLSAAGQLPMAFRDLGSIDPGERDQMMVVLKQLARKLATRLSRRYRMTAGRKRIDFSRTIRANVRFGGVMMQLKYRRRDVRRPRLVVLADVSGSMRRYSEFVLLFVYGLMRSVSGVECFAFSEDLVRVQPGLNTGDVTAVGATLAEVVKYHGQTTNLGNSLRRLSGEYGDLLTAKSIVIVVSDTKTKGVSDAAVELAEMARKVRSVLWLNTVPADEWKRLPGVVAFSRYCTMRECYTLAQLHDIMRDALRAV